MNPSTANAGRLSEIAARAKTATEGPLRSDVLWLLELLKEHSQHLAGAEEQLADLEAEANSLAADRDRWQHRYYEDARTYWDGELPPGGELCAVCYTPVESEPCPDHHPATVAARVTGERDQARAQVRQLEDENARLRTVSEWSAALEQARLRPNKSFATKFVDGTYLAAVQVATCDELTDKARSALLREIHATVDATICRVLHCK